MPIRFFSEGIEFKLKHPRLSSRWILQSTKKEGFSVKELSYIFCSDFFLLRLNQSYLHHNTLTDIITFDYSEDNKSVSGEIYISVERVKENAEKFGAEFTDELDRVMIHGVLHLIGYKDKSQSQKKVMRRKESAYLSLRK